MKDRCGKTTFTERLSSFENRCSQQVFCKTIRLARGCGGTLAHSAAFQLS